MPVTNEGGAAPRTVRVHAVVNDNRLDAEYRERLKKIYPDVVPPPTPVQTELAFTAELVHPWSCETIEAHGDTPEEALAALRTLAAPQIADAAGWFALIESVMDVVMQFEVPESAFTWPEPGSAPELP